MTTTFFESAQGRLNMHNPNDDEEVDSIRCRRQEIHQIKNKSVGCQPPLYNDNEVVNVDVEISALPCTK
ncbi:hypothetical protein ACOSQ3_006795 [Xanthoceras sorbifolium]